MALNNTTKEQFKEIFHKHESLPFKLLKLNKENVKYININYICVCVCVCVCVWACVEDILVFFKFAPCNNDN